MIQKKKNKKIGVILCAMFICLCSILCIIPFNKQEKIEVYADEIVSDGVVFVSSNLIIPTSRYYRGYSNGTFYVSQNSVNSYDTVYNFGYLYTNFSVKFRYSQDDGTLQFQPSLYSLNLFDSDGFISNSGSVGIEEYVYINYMDNNYSNYKYDLVGDWLNLDDWSVVTSTAGYTSRLMVTNSSGLNYIPNNNSSISGVMLRIETSNISIDISKLTHMEIYLDSRDGTNEAIYYVTYFDSNLNYVKFCFYCGRWLDDLSLRTYYFNTGNFTDSEYYDQGYRQGQQSGYNSGYDAGRQSGYNTGYSVGYDEGYYNGSLTAYENGYADGESYGYENGYADGESYGYENGYADGESYGYDNGYAKGELLGYSNGYSDGLDNASEYSFLSLLSATIDAPVKYFQSLFNFELLGVNLQGFLTGLFTLCVIVTIIKLCLGG